MLKLNLFLLNFLILTFVCTAQLVPAKIWCFGDHTGLDFRNNPPTAISTSIYCTEGSSGAVDEKGNIIFYTDGITVFNKNHQQMVNGDNLTAGASSSQSAIVLQHQSQKASNLFYIIAIPEYAQGPGLCYSIVDMNKQGGLGEVISKNNVFFGITSEEVQPAMHSNGIDYWLVAAGHSNREFYVFLIDQNGINLKKTYTLGNPIDNTIGCMKFNRTYDKFVLTCYDYSGYFELLNFDNTTGAISNPIIIDNLYAPYGVEFSASGNVLYISQLLSGGNLRQYNLSTYNKTSIENSLKMISTGIINGNMMTGIDGKIYMPVLGKSYLNVINNPEFLGNGCNLVVNQTSLGADRAFYGLPLMFEYTNKISSVKNLTVSGRCITDSFTFVASGVSSSDSIKYLVDTGTGFKVISRNKYKFNKEGAFKVRLSIKDSSGLKFIDKTINVEDCKACKIKIPNIFTPNGDSINDYFQVEYTCPLTKLRVMIYDRWGLLMYESNDPNFKWNGTNYYQKCSDGVYYYIIEYTMDFKEKKTNGVVHIVQQKQ